MLKNKIELIRDGVPQVLLTWHKRDENGEVIPLAIEFLEELDDEMVQRINDVCNRPINVMENGVSKKGLPGSSTHFGGLPRILARLGFRTRVF